MFNAPNISGGEGLGLLDNVGHRIELRTKDR